MAESDEPKGRQGWRERKRLRLPNYDYSQRGAYFVTLCAQDRLCVFGEVSEGRVQLSAPGSMVAEVWRELSTTFQGVIVDTFVVMPNHLHGVLILEPVGPTRDGGSRRLSLPDIIQRFKTFTMTRYIAGVRTADWPRFPGRLWQRNYFEHIIRDEEALNRVRQYIERNPIDWDMDPENPESSPSRG